MDSGHELRRLRSVNMEGPPPSSEIPSSSSAFGRRRNSSIDSQDFDDGRLFQPFDSGLTYSPEVYERILSHEPASDSRSVTSPEPTMTFGNMNGTERRTSNIKRKPIGATSPETSGREWVNGDGQEDREKVLSPGWDNVNTPWTTNADASRSAAPPEYGATPQEVKKTATATTTPHSRPRTASSTSSGPEDMEAHDDEFDNEIFYSKYKSPPTYCRSKGDIYASRLNWLSITIFVLSIYSTVLSGLWLVVAFIQPRWGHRISTSGKLIPSTATLITALVAKSIELSFVTVFVAFLGQVLTRRSIRRKTNGMTLAEMTMRNWVFQPGSLITHWETIPYAGLTVMGALALTASLGSMFYTTASDAMVSPKLKYGNHEDRTLQQYARSSYANAAYVRQSCTALLDREDNENEAASFACLGLEFAGQSYRDLLGFMAEWEKTQINVTEPYVEFGVAPTDQKQRLAGQSLLYQNTTMYAQWIETDASDIKKLSEKHGRVVNNVTMAYPHPGLYKAATGDLNGILQPADLDGTGEYTIRASAVSPAINVMCVNMNAKELEPVVYTEFPEAKTHKTGVDDQLEPKEPDWDGDLPRYKWDKDGIKLKHEVWLNKTDVDDIFRWGQKHGRRHPIFPMFPADYNMIVNSTIVGGDAIYMLTKSPFLKDYTLCQMRSWVSQKCSSRFDVSGRAGAKMEAHCEDDEDPMQYRRSRSPETGEDEVSLDWKWIADAWRLSMDLNGGTKNVNASNARVLTQLALKEPELSRHLPSMAEALAVFASSSIILSAVDTPFSHTWPFTQEEAPGNIFKAPGPIENFPAILRTQQYTSGHVSEWQKIFYVVLALIFGINCLCLVYFIIRSGLVTDFTEPQNLFALAVNSPPSQQLQGSCGAGPVGRDLVVPWRVAYAPSAEHYFFEEANAVPWRGKYQNTSADTAHTTGMEDLRGESVAAEQGAPTQGGGAGRNSMRGWGLFARKKENGKQKELKMKQRVSSYKRLSKTQERRAKWWWPF